MFIQIFNVCDQLIQPIMNVQILNKLEPYINEKFIESINKIWHDEFKVPFLFLDFVCKHYYPN